MRLVLSFLLISCGVYNYSLLMAPKEEKAIGIDTRVTAHLNACSRAYTEAYANQLRLCKGARSIDQLMTCDQYKRAFENYFSTEKNCALIIYRDGIGKVIYTKQPSNRIGSR